MCIGDAYFAVLTKTQKSTAEFVFAFLTNSGKCVQLHCYFVALYEYESTEVHNPYCAILNCWLHVQFGVYNE